MKRRLQIKIVPLLLLATASPALADEAWPVGGEEVGQVDEAKLSYMDSRLSRAGLLYLVGNVIKEFSDSRSAGMAELLDRPYLIGQRQSTLVIHDTYLDSVDRSIATANAFLRLRYRYANEFSYQMSRILPGLAPFHPKRCDIQAKSDYRTGHGWTMIAEESRFEFRKDAEPFRSYHLAPPPAPWDYETFLGYAKRGRYDRFQLATHVALAKAVAVEELPELEVAATTVTTRDRLPLAMHNPWSETSLDPPTVLTIGVDEVRATGATERGGSMLFEIEIEIESDISEELNEIVAAHRDAFDTDPVLAEAARFSDQGRRALAEDRHALLEQLATAIEAEFGVAPLPPLNRYRRLLAPEPGS